MGRHIAFVVFIGVTLAATGAYAACPAVQPKPTKPQAAKNRDKIDNCVDLNAVPQISANVVAAEPTVPVAKSTYTPPASTQYEGPTLGMTKSDPGVRPTPTVGYHWSLE